VKRFCKAIAAGICGQKARFCRHPGQFSFCKMVFIHFVEKRLFYSFFYAIETSPGFWTQQLYFCRIIFTDDEC